MDVNVEALLDKVREIAEKTTEAACLAADVAGKKASGFMSSTKANLQICLCRAHEPARFSPRNIRRKARSFRGLFRDFPNFVQQSLHIYIH